MKNFTDEKTLLREIKNGNGEAFEFPDFVNVSPKNHLQIMGRYVDVVS